MSQAVDPSHFRARTASEFATFAAGCFWGVQHVFLEEYPPSQNKGILKTSVGYTGGLESAQNPTYKEVCTGTTNHAEALRIEFDPSTIQYGELVEFFYCTHDPTSLNKQGRNTGTQYRSTIFTHSPEQRKIAEDVTRKVQEEHFKNETIVTQIEEAGPWYDAEEYHQLYLFKEPSGYHCPTHRKHWEKHRVINTA
ncbi:peptide methionine sulfoxide reductase [Suillus ampliporus]|nr:peptide methionine sulfoxide reductase [Suillus ampliporus]